MLRSVGHHVQLFARQMPRAARAGGAEGKRRGARRGHHLRRAAPRTVRRDRHHVQDHAHARDGHEVGARIEGQVAIERRVDCQPPDRAHQDGVTIGRGTHDMLGGDVAMRAGAVLDHHGLAEKRLHLRRHQARGDVGGAARREAHDEADGAAGEGILRPHGRRGEQCRQPGQQRAAEGHRRISLIMRGRPAACRAPSRRWRRPPRRVPAKPAT